MVIRSHCALQLAPRFDNSTGDRRIVLYQLSHVKFQLQIAHKGGFCSEIHQSIKITNMRFIFKDWTIYSTFIFECHYCELADCCSCWLLVLFLPRLTCRRSRLCCHSFRLVFPSDLLKTFWQCFKLDKSPFRFFSLVVHLISIDFFLPSILQKLRSIHRFREGIGQYSIRWHISHLDSVSHDHVSGGCILTSQTHFVGGLPLYTTLLSDKLSVRTTVLRIKHANSSHKFWMALSMAIWATWSWLAIRSCRSSRDQSGFLGMSFS